LVEGFFVFHTPFTHPLTSYILCSILESGDEW
jgi:hypothetical protein